jgi:hypothetical protein
MTLPIGRYAAEGPPVPPDGMPDGKPLSIIRIHELAARNGAGEAVFLVDAWGKDGPLHTVLKIILGVNPYSGDITRAAVNLGDGAGFIACDARILPGNLRDIISTIATDPRPDTLTDGPSVTI